MLLYATALTVITAVGCRKIEEDGQIVYVNQGGNNNGGGAGQTIELKGRITSDTVLRKANTYILSGLVYITGNAKITIEPGTVIEGNYQGANVAALIIARGSKIIADGTQAEPIVFTSNSPVPRSGDWGGIIICGKANINAPAAQTGAGYEVEGGVNNSFGDGLAGGNDDADSSGVLRYIRIEYAGYAFQPDKEINSLTMAGVGNKTTIDYVQTIFAKDDAFEWFGGTVNCKHLIAYKTQDDDFDTDNGFSGKVQFGIILRDSSIADISRSEGFESDNDASGSSNTPQTKAVFSNITAIGPRATLANNGNSLFLTAAQIRRNSGLSIFNSIFLGWPAGLLIDARNGRVMDLNIMDSTVSFKNNAIAGCGSLAGVDASYLYIASLSTPTGWTTDNVKNFFSNPSFRDTVMTNVSDAKLIAPFNYSAPDFVPFGGANGNQTILNGASFADPKLSSGFTPVIFRGACDAAGVNANWWRGWTRFPNT